MKPKYIIAGDRSVRLQKSDVAVANVSGTLEGSQFSILLKDLLAPRTDGKAPNRCPFCLSTPSTRKRGSDSELVFRYTSFWQISCGSIATGHYIVAYGKTQKSATKRWNLATKR